MQVIKRTLLGLLFLGLFSGVLIGGFCLAIIYPLVIFLLLVLALSWMVGDLLCR